MIIPEQTKEEASLEELPLFYIYETEWMSCNIKTTIQFPSAFAFSNRLYNKKFEIPSMRNHKSCTYFFRTILYAGKYAFLYISLCDTGG